MRFSWSAAASSSGMIEIRHNNRISIAASIGVSGRTKLPRPRPVVRLRNTTVAKVAPVVHVGLKRTADHISTASGMLTMASA